MEFFQNKVDQWGPMSVPDYDIVMLALPRWDAAYSSTAYSLARELSRHVRVFYIDNPFTYKDFLFRFRDPQLIRRRKALLTARDVVSKPDPDLPGLHVVTPQLIIPINWLPSGNVYDFLARHNDHVVFRAINDVLKKFDIARFVFINSFNPLFGKFFPPSFKPRLTIYQCVDDISRSAYINRHGTQLERHFVRSSDITLVTSLELKRLKLQDAKEVHYLPNAADVTLFGRALSEELPVPIEFASITRDRKVILYMGNICHRIDYTLLKMIAERPEFVLLLIGPITNAGVRSAGLDSMSNVIFTGPKHLAELPAYVKYSHAGIIPFLCNALTKSIYPLKINEYLAAGKAVITTNFSADIANFAPVARICDSHEQFVAALSDEINADTEQKRLARAAYAAGNNWTARAEELIQLINSKID